MGMLDSRAAPRKGMLDPAALRRMAELQALIGADPSGTGMMTASPGQSTPSWDAFSAANPVPLAYTGMPPGEMPPMQPGMPPPGGMGMPPQTMQMDQGQQPPMPMQQPMPQQPQAPQIAPGEPGEAASADPFFQALAGIQPSLGCGDKGDLFPNTASFPASPPISGGKLAGKLAVNRRKTGGKLAVNGPSESDSLNAQMLAMIRARKARA